MDYEKRRQDLWSKMIDNSILVLFAGEEIIRNADEFYEFTINHSFYYFSGIEQKNSILVLKKINGLYYEELYILNNDPLLAKWLGDFLRPEQACEISGIREVHLLPEFPAALAQAFLRQNLTNLYLDLEHQRSDPYQGKRFRNWVVKEYPQVKLHNCFADIAALRSVKDSEEIACLKKAIEITGYGLEGLHSTLRAGYYEYQIEALFQYNVKANGAKDLAFKTIAASGKNATVLHYWANDCVIPEGALMLLDLGAKYQHYSADITRTYPVNGIFTERQRQIYQIVLNGQKIVMESVRPGISTGELDELLKAYYINELAKIGLLTSTEQLENYYWHGVSHAIGLDTHDIGISKDQPLVAGNIISVEPGLYISEWEIGVRIEDDVLVTPSGFENLSSAIPKEIAEIERTTNVQ